MAADPRSPKRPCLSASPEAIVIVAPEESSTSDLGREQYTRDADFWPADGNLILLAGRSAFRIYCGLLAKNSLVFADMLSAGSADATETFDGCPVVRLPDHPEDLRDFLQYLMPCSPLTYLRTIPAWWQGSPSSPSSSSTPPSTSHIYKYQCQDVQARVLFVLKKYYTSEFTEHDGYAPSKYSLLRPPPQAAVAAVNIARLADTPSMLPFALYIACTLDGRVLDGYKRRDGSVEHLSVQDLKLCMNARGPLGRELAVLVKNMFASTDYPNRGCMQPDSCDPTEDAISVDVQDSLPGQCNALESYRDSIDGWAETLDLCKVCKRRLQARDREERRRVWMRLPGILRLTVEACGFTSGGE